MQKAVWDSKSERIIHLDNIFDCMLAECILSSQHSVKKNETLAKYKVDSLEELQKKQQELFNGNPVLYKIYNSVELPLIPVLINMEERGITVDKEYLLNLQEEFITEKTLLEKSIQKDAGVSFNISSPMQLGNVLVEKFSVPLPKTKTGQYATSESILSTFSGQFTIIHKILIYREYAKLLSTYTQPLIDAIDVTGRVHTTYNQIGAVTGRMSSSNPNLQNIPVTTDAGKRIKQAFIAGKDSILISCDYSQQELRILAHMSGEETLIQAFAEGKDIHKVTAAKIFNKQYNEITREERSRAKTINFGLIYGMSSFGLSQSLGITPDAANTFMKAFFLEFPRVREYFENVKKTAFKNGYVETLLGRRKLVPKTFANYALKVAAEREVINFPIQGTAAECTKSAMILIHKHVLIGCKNLHMLLQVHDELVFEYCGNNSKELHKYILQIKQYMESALSLNVPLTIEVKTGSNWRNMAIYDTAI